MKHVMLPSLCAVAVVASCDPVLAQQPAPVVTTTPPYLNTERGLRVKTLEGREISPSLLKGPAFPPGPAFFSSMRPGPPPPALNGLRPSLSR